MNMLLISGSSNQKLAQSIADRMGVRLADVLVSRFSDGEVRVRLNEPVRGRDVFIIQSTSNPSDTNIMELCMIADAAKRASAETITAVIPYFGYARQDRKAEPRVPISAKLVADILQVSGIGRVVCMDLHAGQIQGFFNIPVDNLYSSPTMLKPLHDLVELYGNAKCVIVSPDAGGVVRARAYAKHLGCSLAIVDKRRTNPNEAEVMNVVGDVNNKVAILIDDMIDTAGTLCVAADAIRANGAVTVVAVATHGVLSGKAIERLNSSESISKVMVCDTIEMSEKAKLCNKLEVLSVDFIFAEALNRIIKLESISTIFEINK